MAGNHPLTCAELDDALARFETRLLGRIQGLIGWGFAALLIQAGVVLVGTWYILNGALSHGRP